MTRIGIMEKKKGNYRGDRAMYRDYRVYIGVILA